MAYDALKKATTPEAKLLFEKAEKLRVREKFPEARGVYADLVKRFAESEYAPRARLHIGDCLVRENRIEEAIGHFSAFIREDESGPWRGQAFIALGDVMLEHKFDGRTAGGLYAKAERLLTAMEKTGTYAPGWKEAVYFVALRSGLLAYIRSGKKKALEWFRKAAAAPVKPKSLFRTHGAASTGIERLRHYLQVGREITPRSVLSGEPSAALLALLGDLYYEQDDFARARLLHGRIYRGELPKATPLQRAWSTYQLARIHNWKFEFQPAIALYREVVDAFPQAPWADEALLQIGVISYTNLDRPDDALRCYREILRKFPESNEAERAAYYIGLVYDWEDRFEEAIKAYRWFIATHPDSDFTEGIRDEDLPELIERMKKAKEAGK